MVALHWAEPCFYSVGHVCGSIEKAPETILSRGNWKCKEKRPKASQNAKPKAKRTRHVLRVELQRCQAVQHARQHLPVVVRRVRHLERLLQLGLGLGCSALAQAHQRCCHVRQRLLHGAQVLTNLTNEAAER